MRSGSWSRTSNHPGQSRVANHRWSPPGMEPPTRLERVTCPLQEGRSASDELRRRAGEAGFRTNGRRGCNLGAPVSHLQREGLGSARYPPPCARCDSNAHCRRTQRRDSCHWSTSTWSRHPVPTRVSCLTGARSQAVCDGTAAGAGFEPAWAGFRVLLGGQSSHPASVREAGVEPASASF
jgi:hypothetical protein